MPLFQAILLKCHFVFNTGKTKVKGIEIHDHTSNVIKVLKVWLKNLENQEDQERLKESTEKVRKAKISADSFVRFHSDFMGLLLMSENRGIAQVIIFL